MGIVIHLFAGAVTFILARWNGSASNFVIWPLLAMGWPFWLLAWLHQRQHRLAELEEADWTRLMAERKAGGGQGKLFEVEEGEAFLMRRRLQTLERVWLSVGSILIFLLLAGNAVFLFMGLTRAQLHPIDKNTAALSAMFLFIQAFVLFLIGMYAGGMARESVWRHIRAGASYMMFCAAATALVIVALLVSWAGWHKADIYLGYAVVVAIGLVSLEILLNFVMNIYRPRAPNVEVRFAYDSRLLELITSPGGILRTAASTLDYQFGFKVSETWFYRFLERAIAPILLFEIIAFYLLTTIVIVGPDQRVMIERFGKPREINGILDPGLHFKWPWPFEAAYRYPAQNVISFVIGYRPEEADTEQLWSVGHFENEGKVLVATARESSGVSSFSAASRETPPPVSLLACNLAVHYRVKSDPASLQKYIYSVGAPYLLLQALAEREMTRYMASVDFWKVMCVDRVKAGQDLKERVQKAADSTLNGQGMGVEILFVGLEGIHPPVDEGVGAYFEEVIAAKENKEAQIRQAEAAAFAARERAIHDARNIVGRALAYRYQRTTTSESEAQRFEKQLAAYNAAPGVYEVRTFLDYFEDSMRNIRKYIVAANGWDTAVIRINFEESQRSSLLDVGSYGKPGEQVTPEKTNEK